MKPFTIYISALILFLLIDVLFLKYIMAPLYINHYPNLLRLVNGTIDVNRYAAIAVYALLIYCLFYFSRQNTADTPMLTVLAQGALLGISLYGVFDLTNLAILKQWSLTVSLVEILWGGCLCSVIYSWIHWLNTGPLKG